MKNTRYISIIFALWTFAFIVKIIIYSVAYNILSNPTKTLSEVTGSILVILFNILTDMVPYFSVLELKFIEIFGKS